MSAGSRIAARVAAGLARAGTRAGAGAYTCTIRRASSELDEPTTPWGDPASPANVPDYFEVTGVEDMREVRDANGTLIGRTKRTLTIDTTGVHPMKSDTIAVGVAVAAVDADTVWEEILAVRPLAPAGVPLLYELELAAG